MKYLTLSADYGDIALREEAAGSLDPEALGLPSELCVELHEWNARYGAVVTLDMADRIEPETASFIEELDREGLELARRVAANLGAAKVRYYSEGRLRYLG